MTGSAGDGRLDAQPSRALDRRGTQSPHARPAPRLSRAESTAALLIAVAKAAAPGDRLGQKDELRIRYEVSVGTFNEAVRIAQSRGIISVRPGPGGGVFAAAPSPMVRLGNSVLALDADGTTVAEAVRIRDALDPLLIEDALWYASPADIAELRGILTDMAASVDQRDADRFVRANWALHARIAEVSPHRVLRSLYVSLLDEIESHTLAVLPGGELPLSEYIAKRHALHTAIVDAIADRDRDRALRLMELHNTTSGVPQRPVPSTASTLRRGGRGRRGGTMRQ
jgi:DNA-binding FadR family transcriptional regulator